MPDIPRYLKVSLVSFPWHRCTLKGVCVWGWGGADLTLFVRDTTEKSECKTLISPDPDEGSLLSQGERSPLHAGCVTATRVRVTCLLRCVHMQMKQKKRGCWAPSRLTSTQTAVCTCSSNACDSPVRDPDGFFQRGGGSTSHFCAELLRGWLFSRWFTAAEGGQQSIKSPIAFYLWRYLSRV